MAKKPPTTSKLKKKADALFSVHIRKSYADVDGKVKCVTCGVRKHWKSMQAGHYIPRSNLSTRWEELNTHVQCMQCNVLKKGNLDEYAIFLIEKYGNNILDLLHKQKQQKLKMKHEDYEKLIEKYASED